METLSFGLVKLGSCFKMLLGGLLTDLHRRSCSDVSHVAGAMENIEALKVAMRIVVESSEMVGTLGLMRDSFPKDSALVLGCDLNRVVKPEMLILFL